MGLFSTSKIKLYMMEAKEKGVVIGTTNYNKYMFHANPEDAYDFRCDEGPIAAVAFHGQFVIHSANQQRCKEEHLDSDDETENETIRSRYLDEIVCLKNANNVARDMLQRFNMPTQTIPMLSKKPKAATADLHKDLLVCIDTSSASNAIFEINKLRKQLQGKDDTIRNLETQINITRMLNVGSTEGSCDQQALETDRIHLKRRYDELSQANTHSRTAYTEKLSALTAENTKLKAQVSGKTSSGPSTSKTPKVLAPGMYNLGVKPTLEPENEPKRAPGIIVLLPFSVSNLNTVCGACNKSLVFANHSNCLVMCDGSVNVVPNCFYGIWILDAQVHMNGVDRARLIYFVEKLLELTQHTLFSVGQFVMEVLEVAFRLAFGQSQLRYGRSTQRFTINQLLLHLTGLALDMLSASPGKSKKASHPLKTENTNTEVLNTLHMDLCGPMRTESINGKKYILVIVDDYTRFGWVRFLRSKDETPQVIEKFIVKTQRALNATVRSSRTDNGTAARTIAHLCESKARAVPMGESVANALFITFLRSLEQQRFPRERPIMNC
ncbi:retrovirus-related pol polyprotein from transposon TNT 1-94 [Tanacetum coccineum]